MNICILEMHPFSLACPPHYTRVFMIDLVCVHVSVKIWMRCVCEWVWKGGRDGATASWDEEDSLTDTQEEGKSPYSSSLSLSYNLNITVSCFSVFLLYLLERYCKMKISWEHQYVCYTAVFVCVCCSWRANWVEQHFYSVTELKWTKCVLVPDIQSPGSALTSNTCSSCLMNVFHLPQRLYGRW